MNPGYPEGMMLAKKELLKPLQEQCIEDRDKCAKIAHIEIEIGRASCRERV